MKIKSSDTIIIQGPGSVIKGKNSNIFNYVKFIVGKHGVVRIGNNTNIHSFCHFSTHGLIKIGNDCRISSGCKLVSDNHIFKDKNKLIRKQGLDIGKIIIEDDVWLGYNVTVLKDVKIGKGSIIGAGSVVTKNVPRYEIWAGVPAKKIGVRK